jgi:hypothetical protein
MEVSGQLDALATLPQAKNPQCPLNRRLGGRRETNPWPCQESNLDCQACRANRKKMDYFMTKVQDNYAI